MKKGEKKQKPSGDELYCWKCGKKITKESEFCKYCGAPTDMAKALKTGEEIKPRRKRSRKVVMVFLVISK